MRSISSNAVARLSRFDPDQLPPSIRGVINVVNKAAQLFSDIKTDVMEFYQVQSMFLSIIFRRVAKARAGGCHSTPTPLPPWAHYYFYF